MMWLYIFRTSAFLVVAYVYFVEFQKRGLPHIHLLLSLASEDKIRTKERIDQFFCAEIPDPTKNLLLFDLITNVMVHGPCDERFCLQKGRCTKGYPKTVNPETYIDQNGFTHCRRRATGHFSNSRGRKNINNGDVVTYMPIIMKIFQGHINAEVMSKSQRTIKYLFKYIFKVRF